jgi:hypothetical protein
MSLKIVVSVACATPFQEEFCHDQKDQEFAEQVEAG